MIQIELPDLAKINQMSKSTGRHGARIETAARDPGKSIKVQNQMGGSERGSKLPAREARWKKYPLSAQTPLKPCVFLPYRRAKRAGIFLEIGHPRIKMGGAERGLKRRCAAIQGKSIKFQNQLGCTERGSKPRRQIW